jgi:hypothetical protein
LQPFERIGITLPFAAVPPLPLSEPRARAAVNWRSVSLGLLWTVLICGLTYYNDNAMNNTYLVGNNLPLGVIMLVFLFVLCVNGPLSKWKPELALSAGELCVALSMVLVSCCLPSSGLMRFFPGSLTGPPWHARSYQEFQQLFVKLDLPEWLWPTFASHDRSEWMNDPIVTGFHQRWIDPGPYPLLAWVRPALTWGAFFAAMYGAVICMMLIVRRQWVENERLPFPLAQIQLSIIQTPARGKWLNSTFGSKSFWFAFAGVFLLHAWNAMGKYYPEYFPTIWTWYDFNRNIFAERPLSFVDSKMKDAAVFFTVVGVTYFLSSSVAFSLWAFYVLHQIYKMYLGVTTGDSSTSGQGDQHLGGLVAFALTMAWVGRRHWRLVLAQAFRGVRPGEERGKYLSYPACVWGLLGCAAVMVGWLVLAGAGVGGAVVIVVTLLFLFLMIGRIIAEVGLVHGQLQVPIQKAFVLMGQYGWKFPVSLETYYLASTVQSVHYDYREVSSVYSSHALRMADSTIDAATSDGTAKRQGVRFIGCLALALFVGYFASLAGALVTEYRYFDTLETPAQTPINAWGANYNPRIQIVSPVVGYNRGVYNLRHSPVAHVTFGFLFTGVLSFLRLRFTGWPLHPIGYLMIGTFPGAHLWFSIMIGWLLKTLIVKFGGARAYTSGKPIFLGLIVGESVAAGFWLVVGVVLGAMNIPYKAIIIMPG